MEVSPPEQSERMRRILRTRALRLEGKKHCNFCDKDKPLDQFGALKTSLDGRQWRCKTCHKIYKAQNRHKTIERERALSREWKRNNRDKCNRYTKEKAARTPIQSMCVTIVRHAIACGKLKKEPCRICGEAPAQAHHNNYQHPLDVVWLCQSHHNAWHRIFLAEYDAD